MDLKHLQTTQDEMMKKLALIDDDSAVGGEHSEASSTTVTPKSQKKSESGSTKRHRWKTWGWKHSPAKSSSIEEEPSASLLDSPKRSHSSKSSTPNQSPKHNYINSDETLVNCDEASTPFRRRKQQKSNASKAELRSSAGARLIQIIDNKDGIERLDSDDEFRALLPENGRPASIHIIQTLSRPDEL